MKILEIFFRVQACGSVMRRYFCIEFIDDMLASKTLTDCNNSFPQNNLRKTEPIILIYTKVGLNI